MPPPVLALVSGQALPAFLLCSTLLVIKMYVVAVITGQVRLRKKAFANPEDALRHGGLQYCRSDQDVDRCLSSLPLAPLVASWGPPSVVGDLPEGGGTCVPAWDTESQSLRAFSAPWPPLLPHW
ncbi:prostaglandin E synthase isoform X2 [Vulpes vulpes]|uniref:Prostaglandin E synthase isoform X2 n=1 Tax=Vulpes vulpes TaxID=9627 RepID=A0ABM4ZPL9_VULVU